MTTAVDTQLRPDPDGNPETRTQREERIMADASPVTMRTGGRLIGRSLLRMRELHSRRLCAIRALRVPEGVDPDRFAMRVRRAPASYSPAQVEAAEVMTDVMPAPLPDKVGLAWVWPLNEWMRWARRTGRVDEWFEPAVLNSPGRPPKQR